MASKQGRELRFAAKQEKRHVEKKVIGKSKVKATKQSDKEFREMKWVRARVCLVQRQGPQSCTYTVLACIPVLHSIPNFVILFVLLLTHRPASALHPHLIAFASPSLLLIIFVDWRMVGWSVGL